MNMAWPINETSEDSYEELRQDGEEGLGAVEGRNQF
jgi:hypothetical protein